MLFIELKKYIMNKKIRGLIDKKWDLPITINKLAFIKWRKFYDLKKKLWYSTTPT